MYILELNIQNYHVSNRKEINLHLYKHKLTVQGNFQGNYLIRSRNKPLTKFFLVATFTKQFSSIESHLDCA